jgi:hypothetical protein
LTVQPASIEGHRRLLDRPGPGGLCEQAEPRQALGVFPTVQLNAPPVLAAERSRAPDVAGPGSAELQRQPQHLL